MKENKRLILVLICCLGLLSARANLITKYQFWFDGNYSTAVTQTITGDSVFNLNNVLSTLTATNSVLHELTFRIQDDSGRWSVPICQYFLKYSQVSAYEYWCDTSYSSKQLVTLPSVASDYILLDTLSSSIIPPGLHTMHIRIKDADGKWSAALSEPIYKGDHLSTFEYWFDQNRSSTNLVSFSSPDTVVYLNSLLSMNTLSTGIHLIEMRLKDEGGQWSSAISSYFFKGAENIANYQYWFDNNYANAITVPANNLVSFELNDELTSSNVSNAILHTITSRIQDNSGAWSAATSSYFMKATKLVAYEYWIDEDYTNRNVSSISSTDQFILISNLSPTIIASGLHMLHIRVKDEDGKWSVALNEAYYKGANLTKIEYWFDHDFANKQSVNASPADTMLFLNSQFNTTSVSSGLHAVNIRIGDEGGRWSEVMTSYFFISASSIVKFQYWFDGNYNNATTQSTINASSVDLSALLQTANIANAIIHDISIRVQDDKGVWSEPVREYFVKQSHLVEYEYWYDDVYASRISGSIPSSSQFVLFSNLNTTSFPSGLRQLQFRIKDENGKWSSTLSQPYYKGSLISQYEYWFDDNFASKATINLSPAASITYIQESLSLTGLDEGLHRLNSRTRDEGGTWSVTSTEYFNIGSQQLIGYEYWFDLDYAARQFVSIPATPDYSIEPTLDVSALAAGSHTINLRFKDKFNKFSEVIVDAFCNSLGDSLVTLKLYLEGYYDGLGLMKPVLLNQGISSNPNLTDSIDVQLRNQNPPYDIVTSKRVELTTNGQSAFNFPPAIEGSYYLTVSHRNSIETWTTAPVYKAACLLDYDFTTSASKAYGDNQTEIELGIFAFFTGDLNQDDNIDLIDIPMLETDINNFEYGYFKTDLNGDGNVDLVDNPILENNINNFVFSNHP